jgi:hypothetical protein
MFTVHASLCLVSFAVPTTLLAAAATQAMYVSANPTLVNNTTVLVSPVYVAAEQQLPAGLLSQLSNSSSSSSSTAAAASFSGLPAPQQQQQQLLPTSHAHLMGAVGDEWLLPSIGSEEEDLFVDIDKLLEDVIELPSMQPCLQQQLLLQQTLGCSSGPAPSMLDLLLQP